MTDLLREAFFALWFFLPAGVANMVPVFAAHIPLLSRLDQPMDFGRSWRGKRIFGNHKTWRGLITGVIFATITLAAQQWLVRRLPGLAHVTAQVDYASLPTLVLGPLFALGALLGDAVESFFKRQRGIAPGNGWFPFDQTDFVVGGAIATVPFVQLSFLQYTWLLLLWLGMHLLFSYVGYRLGLKDKPI